MKVLGREGRGKRGAKGSQRGRIRLLNLTEQSTSLGGSATYRHEGWCSNVYFAGYPASEYMH